MIILLGSTGYVGKKYVSAFEINGIEYTAVPSRTLLGDGYFAYLENLLKHNPNAFVLNAAGYTGKPNVDACESNKGECLEGNVTFPYRVAKLCAKHGVDLGHVSSGCIYTGKKGDLGFTEEDEPNFSFKQNNCSFYSGTKALGEEVLAEFPNVYIWRLRIPFDSEDNPRNYLTKILTYPMLVDAENSVSDLTQFVGATLECQAKKLPFGIYNVTNPGTITTKGVVEMIKKYTHLSVGKEFNFFDSIEEFNKTVKAPRSNCVLDSSKLLDAGIGLNHAYYSIEKALYYWKKA